ncbi:MAG: hypothetical protein RIF32_13485 [Leptospirales bacterium]|jgi:hypothetical protein
MISAQHRIGADGDTRGKLLSFFVAALLTVSCLALTGVGCQPSRFLEKRHVTYNFEEEGFLSNRVLQTIGQAGLSETTYGTEGARRLCLSAAEGVARERSLRVMLHTRLELSANQPAEIDFGSATFDRDYPLTFTARDMIRAEVDFRSILDRGFIALQENRGRDACSVVFRIESRSDADLPAEIRAVRLSFQPENQRLWRKQREAQEGIPPIGGPEGAPLPSPAPGY